MGRIYTDEIKQFVYDNHKGVGPKAMTGLVNETFGTSYTQKQLNAFYKNHKLNSGLTGRFEKGSVPPNKGVKGVRYPGCEATWFKKGQKSINHKEIGSERVDAKDGYLIVKIAEPDVWELKHRYIYEQANGKIPKGYVLNFKNGDKTDIRLDNLVLLSKAEHLELTRSKLRSNDTELAETGVLVAKLKVATRNRARG